MRIEDSVCELKLKQVFEYQSKCLMMILMMVVDVHSRNSPSPEQNEATIVRAFLKIERMVDNTEFN